MRPALILVDLQRDFLNNPQLEPHSAEIVERVSYLLQQCRYLSIPIIHVWTAIELCPDTRMPHWQKSDRRLCVKNTMGYYPPEELKPITPEELIIHKTFFSGFESPLLHTSLKQQNIDTLLIAGIYLHACIRTTVLEAYQKGYQIWIAEDATGSYDLLHSAITSRYLQGRAANFATVNQLISLVKSIPLKQDLTVTQLPVAISTGLIQAENLPTLTHFSPHNQEKLWRVPLANQEIVSNVCHFASIAHQNWENTEIKQRASILHNLAILLEQEKKYLATQLAIELGKPITYATAEVNRAIALLQEVIKYQDEPLVYQQTPQISYRYQPLGLVALITPYNNPLAIPIGKIGPALLYGNTVIWKPSPAGSGIALKLMTLLTQADCPPGVVNLILGDRHTATNLMCDSRIKGVSFTGSSIGGYTVQEICASRRIPLQAELGGNNGAIVWYDCDLVKAAHEISLGAFGYAGQRCTANRRAIVHESCYEQFLSCIYNEVNKLQIGDPLDTKTNIGPLISQAHFHKVAEIVKRAKQSNLEIYSLPLPEALKQGNYYPPTIICCDDPKHEIVQEETFAPILVIQKAKNWEEAISLTNGVKQGLVAALFSESKSLQKLFINQVQVGVLKLNSATTDVDVNVPFGGWKNSGIGYPEHGVSNRNFYTHLQAIYNL
jgi:acyl-CoA reductase-like NAD-dependent aldehyde dehydrogenase/nicotinamidase-related amidase